MGFFTQKKVEHLIMGFKYVKTVFLTQCNGRKQCVNFLFEVAIRIVSGKIEIRKLAEENSEVLAQSTREGCGILKKQLRHLSMTLF